MAPNRKTHDLFASHGELASLKATIQPKYLPLTSTESGNRSQAQPALPPVTDPRTEKAPPAVSYWDWSPDTAEATKAAEIDDLFSLSRLETNLVSDSLQRNERNQAPPTLTPAAAQESFSYWDWSTEDDVETDSRDANNEAAPPAAPQPQQSQHPVENYWTWQDDAATNRDAHAHAHAAPSEYLHGLVADSRKKYHRRHSHLHPETQSASDRYWHWSEFRGTLQ